MKTEARPPKKNSGGQRSRDKERTDPGRGGKVPRSADEQLDIGKWDKGQLERLLQDEEIPQTQREAMQRYEEIQRQLREQLAKEQPQFYRFDEDGIPMPEIRLDPEMGKYEFRLELPKSRPGSHRKGKGRGTPPPKKPGDWRLE